MYLYLPLSRPKACIYFGRKALSRGHSLILDLEDSVQNLDDIELTRDLKDDARCSVRRVMSSVKKSSRERIFIRINAVSTEFYSKDIEMVKDMAKWMQGEGECLGIFVPKISRVSYEEIISDLRRCPNVIIVAMIEGEEGFKFLGDLSKSRELEDERKIKAVHYGHFDYCLDSGIFPFTEYGSSHFWLMTGRLLAAVRQCGIKEYIQTPYPYLDSDNIARLKECDQLLRSNVDGIKTSSCVLGYESLVESREDEEIRVSDISYAKDLVRQFRSAQRIKRSFSTIGGRFIPPHEYYAAKRFLESIE